MGRRWAVVGGVGGMGAVVGVKSGMATTTLKRMTIHVLLRKKKRGIRWHSVVYSD
jgi:hypothetical protein